MPSLGGSIFVHNAIRFDYCIAESIASLCGVCDEVVVLDAESDDGTQDLLTSLLPKYSNLKVRLGAKWECHPKYERLSILANQAKDMLRTDWHFMLQADEVIHEDSYHWIRAAVNNKENYDSYRVRRINLFGDTEHYFRFNLEQHKKPCSDTVDRLSHIKYHAVSDAESLSTSPDSCYLQWIDKIQIWHYGFVRDDELHCDKVIDMQSWFHGPNSQPDQRVVKMKKKDGVYDWTKLKEKDDLDKIPWKHPQVARKWVKKRQNRKYPV